MMIRTASNPEVIRERIVRAQSELRRLRAELRLVEAEHRDRERLAHPADVTGQKRKGPGGNPGKNMKRKNYEFDNTE
jgi:hypothetical protein